MRRRKKKEEPTEPPVYPPESFDIIPARDLVPAAFADLEVTDYHDPAQLLGDQHLIDACINLLARTGCEEFTTRVDQDIPMVFMFLARWGDHWEAAAGTKLSQACFRLVQHMVDGGLCVHCGKPTGVARDFADDLDAEYVCWYQFDPELRRFRRSCEGEADERNAD